MITFTAVSFYTRKKHQLNEGVEFPWVKGKKSFIRFKICVPFNLERISRIVAKIYKKAEVYLNEKVIAITVLFVIGKNFSCLKECSWRIGYISFGSTLGRATPCVCVRVCVCVCVCVCTAVVGRKNEISSVTMYKGGRKSHLHKNLTNKPKKNL